MIMGSRFLACSAVAFDLAGLVAEAEKLGILVGRADAVGPIVGFVLGEAVATQVQISTTGDYQADCQYENQPAKQRTSPG